MKRKMMTTLSAVLAAVMLMTGCGAGTDRNSDEVSTQEHDENAMVHLDGLEDASKLFDDIYAQVLEKNQKFGLLVRENGRIFLTKRGREVSNVVMSEFLLD